MTLLAKALFDNLADAPDELSFRKGDIVTVIEQDVDGLVGWWLCLLHGRQGIAPGNRLRVLPSVEDSAKKSPNQGYLKPESPHSFDFTDGTANRFLTQPGSEYDVLPAPVKASHGELFDSPSPKTLKDVYTSRSKSPSNKSPVPTSIGNVAQPQSDYDILPAKGAFNKGTKMTPEQLYDIPTSAVQNDDLYDVIPKRKSIQSTLTPAPNTPTPKFQNVLSAFTAIPDEDDTNSDPQSQLMNSSITSPNLKGGAPSDLYDYLPNMFATTKADTEKSFLKTGSSDLYDIPTNNRLKTEADKLTKSSEDLYSVPPQSGAAFRRNFNFSSLGQGNGTKLNEGNTTKDLGLNANQELYDVPVPSHQFANATSEIYDIPPSKQSIQTSSYELYDTPPSLQNLTSSHEIYDTPARSINDTAIYDMPPKRNDGTSMFSKPGFGQETKNDFNEIYDVPPSQNNELSPSSEIYDIPPNQTKGITQSKLQSPEQYEIYDTPNSALHDRQAHTVDGILHASQADDIYDTPSSEEIYDQPPKRIQPLIEGHEAGNDDDLYDIPTKHDVDKVMNDISRYKTTNQSFTKAFSKRQGSNFNGAVSVPDDDDYVDYQDIYGKEPPAEIIKEMEKAPETTPRVIPTKPARKKSLDQINMSAVKELKLNQMQAYERLNKLHLAVDTSITALLSYSSGDWLNHANLSQNITAIQDMSSKVKLALRLLTEFGLGAVVNAKVMNLESEADEIKSDIEPLLECYYRIKVCLLHLDSCRWIVPEVKDSSNEKFYATVNAIMILAGRVPDPCRKLTSTLHSSVTKLFADEESLRIPENTKGLSERMADLKLKSNLSKSTEMINSEKGKLKPVGGTVDDKKVREILELDARPVSKWIEQDTSHIDRANGADMSPMEMKQEFQSRRQKGYNSTLPRRPPVPPKPTLPTNRRSMAAFIDDGVVTPQTVAKADTLVTDFITEDGRKKYASDPSRSPIEPEPARKPEWGGSCPQLDDHTTYSTPPHVTRATSTGTAASSTSTTSLNNSADDLDANANLNKVASDSNIFAQTMLPSRVTEPVGFSHVRSASLPWDDNKIPFTSYENRQNSPSNSFQGNPRRLSKLDHRDSEAITFFLQRVESQVLVLRGAVRNLTESVSNNEAPQLFVPHSKFVILTAHKVVHAGEELCGKLLNKDVKSTIKRATGRLADSIRGVVAGTKQAALDYPNQNSLMEMMTTVLSVGESVREVHKEAKKALEL